ncbi:hypothetical protein [Nocardia salmonicida]|uniref:hypothetical protein n=1 Tax=Nocardia salmonicida TaxID=53431 RepID=UPI0033FCD5F8
MPDNANLGLVEAQNDLVRQLADILVTHPAGKHFRLLFAPNDLALDSDEVLIQTVDRTRRVVELTPRRVNDLTIDSVIHEAQVVDPSDEEFNEYSATATNRAYRLDRNK